MILTVLNHYSRIMAPGLSIARVQAMIAESVAAALAAYQAAQQGGGGGGGAGGAGGNGENPSRVPTKIS